jgi:hypothetical protein
VPGLGGFAQNRQVPPRTRRNAAKLAKAIDLIFAGALTIGGDGIISITLKTDGGLADTGDELFVVAGQGIEVGAGGVAADLGAGLDFDGSNQIEVQVDDTTISINGSNELVANLDPATYMHGIYVEFPSGSDELPIAKIRNNSTVTEVRGHTDTGTVTLNIERRAESTTSPDDVAGTDVCSDDLVADSDGQETTTFDDSGEVDADEWLYLAVTSISSSPTKLWVTIKLEPR